MSVKNDLLKAKKLIQAKRYEDARSILITIDHPIAKKWLSKLPQPQSMKTKNLQTGCGFILLGIFLCSLIFALFPFTATEGDIVTAAYSINGVIDVERVIVGAKSHQVYVDVCVAGNHRTIAEFVTNTIRHLNGMNDMQLFVSVTDATKTHLYVDGILISDSEREFCF